jgi:hypothetical protein
LDECNPSDLFGPNGKEERIFDYFASKTKQEEGYEQPQSSNFNEFIAGSVVDHF